MAISVLQEVVAWRTALTGLMHPQGQALTPRELLDGLYNVDLAVMAAGDTEYPSELLGIYMDVNQMRRTGREEVGVSQFRLHVILTAVNMVIKRMQANLHSTSA